MSALNAAVDALAADFARRLVALVRGAPLAQLAGLRIGPQTPAASAPRTIGAVGDQWGARYTLSRAELEILVAAAGGQSRAELARARSVSPNTLKRQAVNLLRKTGDASLLHAVTRLLREVIGQNSRRRERRP